MRINPDIFLLTADLGYKLWDDIIAEFPKRAMNVGASEQAMIDIAIGLAYDGKIPFCYSITPFLLFRPFEGIRTYVDYENLNVKLVGGGRNDDYHVDGISHDATDIGLYLNQLKNISQHFPQDKREIKHIVEEMVNSKKPEFISLKR